MRAGNKKKSSFSTVSLCNTDTEALLERGLRERFDFNFDLILFGLFSILKFLTLRVNCIPRTKVGGYYGSASVTRPPPRPQTLSCEHSTGHKIIWTDFLYLVWALVMVRSRTSLFLGAFRYPRWPPAAILEKNWKFLIFGPKSCQKKIFWPANFVRLWTLKIFGFFFFFFFLCTITCFM